MKKAGGIIALIAGIFGIIAAIVTMFIGGVGAAFGGEGAETIIGLGWGGILFSFLTIIFGAIAMNAKSKVPGILLIICAIAGAILGGTFVAIFMVLALVGGILAVIGTKKAETTQAS
ncbi:MAG TPA: hypothetical protein PLD48_09620 [Bacillota bacterium]|nr:hypothetical protein [Bacillota bacterium]HOK68918.1 hypothetical protein [Bacillota bacterium]HPP85296.1 hypothetical protein [Bacillota bacterium]